MTIAEIIDKLRQEREIGSRFPARIIFCDELSSYSALITQLKSACDVTINIADFGKKDVVPQFDKMRDALSQYKDKQVLLLSVGEYLRMCIKRELNTERAQFLPFWEAMQQEASKSRYIMPMFACRDSFDRIVGKIDERQESFVWNLTSNGTLYNKQYSISVFSPRFAEAISADADNFEQWLRYWDTILRKEVPCAVITNQHRNVEASFGTITLVPIDSPFAFICSVLKDSDKIEQSWEPDDFWAKLIPCLNNEMNFTDVVTKELGITSFDFISIFARWSTLTSLQRELVWLWYRVYPTDDYYSYACKKAKKSSEIPARIKDEILLISSRSERWINERMKAMQVFGFSAFDDAYFRALDKLPVAEMKLQLLTYKTHEEKAFAVKTVSTMLRNGANPEAIADLLSNYYPILSAYLKDTIGIDTEIDEYFLWYRTNKIINRFPGNYSKRISFDRFDARFKLLNKVYGKDCYILWIDGFGIEWLPAFLKELELLGIQPATKNIATAKLPTETEYNHQWNENDPLCEKWNRLDSYSHKGMPDDNSYYSCIVYQLSVLSDAAKRVEELLSQHDYVAITGDHGSSRLAALAFHDSIVIPVTAPQKSKVRSFGRFCELSDEGESYITLDFMKKVSFKGKTYIVMRDYNQFSISGNAAGGNTDERDVVGEIHGGDTPEERLVPVVIVKSSRTLSEMICKPISRFVTRKNGHVETTLVFNREVNSLEVSIDSINTNGICTKNDDGSWGVSFEGVTGKELNLSVVADGNLINTPVVLKVKSQGIENKSGMGGLP